MSRLTALTAAVERTLLACSVILLIVVHFGGWLAPNWFQAYFPFGDSVWQHLPAAQVVLLAGWLVCALVPRWLRLAATPVLLCTWAVVWGGRLASESAAQWLLLAGVCTTLLLLSARCVGFRLSIERPATTTTHPQFSLGTLILFTTLIAAILGILEWLRPMIRRSQELSIVLEQMLLARYEASVSGEFLAGVNCRTIVLAGTIALIAVAAMASVLRPGAMWLRLLVTAVFVPLLGLYLGNLAGNNPPEGISLAVNLSILAAIVGISVWPLRLLGVRIRRTGFQPVVKMFQGRLKTCASEKAREPRTAAA